MHFRPGDNPRSDPTDQSGPVEWADNVVSNTMAWASYRVTPGWCQTEDHWSSRLTQSLFTDCPCCLLFRGLIVGVVIGLSIATAIVGVTAAAVVVAVQ